MKQQQAFTEKRKMLKGGLHCHTTRSDGALSPEETIRLHYENGYDFLALTDHRIYNYQNFAPDIPITILPGMEYDSYIEGGKGFRVFHTVCIGPAREDGNGYAQDETFESANTSTWEEYQPYLDAIHAKGNLTILCHPEWSSTPARYFENLQGNFAMEIRNTGCVLCNDMDKDAAYWDEILGQGKRIFGVATDDGHRPHEHCKSWVMVNAENNISSILSALKGGKFYSTTGPEIYNFYVENETAVIECSPVSMVRFHSMMHPTQIIRSDSNDLTRCELPLRGFFDYVRVSIIDKNGEMAWTNPIFLD